MHCTDFIFDDELLSDHGLMICSFNNTESTWSGGNVTFTTIKPPNSNRQTFYTSYFENPITFTFQIGKKPCGISTQEEMYFSQDEISDIMQLLQRTDGYHWLAFYQDGWEDIWFNSQINLQPYYICGRIVGYDVTVNTDSPYGYSHLIKKTFSLSANGGSFILKNYSDILGCLYPKAEITITSGGTLIIESGCSEYKHRTEINNVNKGDVIILDRDNDFFSGIKDLNGFNFKFPILAKSRKDISTSFINYGTAGCEVKITYRYVRRVSV